MPFHFFPPPYLNTLKSDPEQEPRPLPLKQNNKNQTKNNIRNSIREGCPLKQPNQPAPVFVLAMWAAEPKEQVRNLFIDVR